MHVSASQSLLTAFVSGSRLVTRRLGGGKPLFGWVENRDWLVGRSFYSHTVSGEEKWEKPFDWRTYLSVGVLMKLAQSLDIWDVETLKSYFVMLDVRQTGLVGVEELYPVFRVLKMKVRK